MLSHKITKALINQGLVPLGCRQVELLMPADGVFMFRYEVFVASSDLPKLAAAFTEMAEEDRATIMLHGGGPGAADGAAEG